MDKRIEAYIKIINYMTKMSQLEKDSLFSDLIGAYIFDNKKAETIELLIQDKFLEFKKLAEKMNKEGKNLKEILKEK